MKKTLFQFCVLCSFKVAIYHKCEKYWINVYLSWPAHKEFISIEEKIDSIIGKD